MTTSKILHAGNVLLAGFGAMLIMMSVLVYLSVKQDIPMVNKNYYEQELKYQNKLDAMQNATAYKADFQVQRSNGIIELSIPAVLAQQLDEGTIHFYSPSSPERDRSFNLEKSKVQYAFTGQQVPPGMYRVKISISAGGQEYFHELKLP